MSLLMASFSTVSANESQTIGQQLDSAVLAIQAFTQEKKDKTRTQVETTLNNLDERIKLLENKLAEKWDSMDAATQKEAQRSLQVLHENRSKVAQWMGSMQQSTSSAWHKVKDGFSAAYSALENSWQDNEAENSSQPHQTSI